MPDHQSAIKDSIKRLFDTVNAISVQGYDQDRQVIYWNKGSELVYGYTAAEALGRKIEQLIIPEHMRPAVIAAHEKWINQGVEIPASELVLCNKLGEDVSVFSSHVMFYNEYDQYEMYCVDIDLSEVKKAQDQAVLKESLLKALIETTPDLFFLLKENGDIIDYYVGDNNKLLIHPKHFMGKRMVSFLPEDVATNFQNHIDKAIAQGGMTSLEYKLNMPKGLTYFEARISYLQSHQQLLAIIRDITEAHKTAELIKKQAYYDTLTSLPNRFLSLDRLSQMIVEMERDEEKAAVLFLDIDDFKKVNDSLGHETGDKLLVEVANRLRSSVRRADTVGRLGGDEFIILLRSLHNSYDATEIAKHLLDNFRKPFKIDGKELILTLSIGISVYPENGICASELLSNADTAMYKTKESGSNAYLFFTKEMNDIILRRLEIEGQLHGALERNELEVYYQPKVSVKDGTIIGAEALLRWQSSVLGSVSPDEFIPVAENTGLIVAIGEYVVQQALGFLVEWRNSHKKDYTMAVNLSPRQFREDGFVNFVETSIAEFNLDAKSLELEITEGVLMIGKSYINVALDKLHKLGVKLSMDDFGTGYSSLSYLRHYSFDVLKIDRSFVDGIAEKKSDRDLVTATIAMAHSLGLLVVAEGVETQQQLKLLATLNCDIAQGYYFSRPVPAKELLAFRINPVDFEGMI